MLFSVPQTQSLGDDLRGQRRSLWLDFLFLSIGFPCDRFPLSPAFAKTGLHRGRLLCKSEEEPEFGSTLDASAIPLRAALIFPNGTPHTTGKELPAFIVETLGDYIVLPIYTIYKLDCIQVKDEDDGSEAFI